VGKAEGQGKVQKGYRCLQETCWSQADECSYAEEIVGIDEGAVGGKKEGENSIDRTTVVGSVDPQGNELCQSTSARCASNLSRFATAT
jgi:hypothetical protein